MAKTEAQANKNGWSKKTPDKPGICICCSTPLTQQSVGGKYLESPNRLKARKFCNVDCYVEWMRRENQKDVEKVSINGKQCSKCLNHRPAAEFPRTKTRYASYCNTCWTRVRREYRLKKCYNLTLDDYETMFTFQQGKCAICSRPPKSTLHIDHDHKTGMVRGLLCWHCNVLLGKSKDNVDRLAAAVRYLQSPPATQALGTPRIGSKGRITNKSRRKRK